MPIFFKSPAKVFFSKLPLPFPTFHLFYWGCLCLTQTQPPQNPNPKTPEISRAPLLGIGRLCFSLHRWIFKSLDGKEGGQNTWLHRCERSVVLPGCGKWRVNQSSYIPYWKEMVFSVFMSEICWFFSKRCSTKCAFETTVMNLYEQYVL